MNCVDVLLKLLFEECPFRKSVPASRVILLLLVLIALTVHLSYQSGKGAVVGDFSGVFLVVLVFSGFMFFSFLFNFELKPY